MRIAILDDYQSVARTMADWSPLNDRAEVTVFSDRVADEDALAERLAPFDILCIMRERFALRLDVTAAAEHGIEVVHTGYSPS